MAMACRICNHKERLSIDREICTGISYTKIARQYGLSRDSVAHHAGNHLSRQLTQAMAKKTALESADLLAGIEDLLRRTKDILSIAERKKKYGLALSAVREARGSYELLSKIAFALHQVRLSELEILQHEDGTLQRQEQEKLAGLLCDRLNPEELDLLERLFAKVRGETNENVVPYTPPVWPVDKPIRRMHRRPTTEPKGKESDPLTAEPDDKQTQEPTTPIGSPTRSRMIPNSSEHPDRLPARHRALRRRMINAKMMEPDPDLDN